MKSNDKTRPDRGTRKKEPSARTSTQVKTLQTKIQETEDRFQIIFDGSPDGMVIINPTENAEGPWLIENCNRSFCEMNGFNRSELIGKDIREVSNETAAEIELSNKYHEKINGGPGNEKTHRREYYQRLKQGPIKVEEIHKRKDGSTFYIQSSSCLITLGGQERVLGIDRDITESKRTEEALRKNEAQLRAVLDATPFPVALVDVQGNNIDFWSRSALTLFGHTAPTATEWYQIAYPHPDYRRDAIDRWKVSLEKARFSDQAVNAGEYRVACRDGSVRICELYATFLEDRLIVTFNDVTERKQAEEALLASQQIIEGIINSIPIRVFWKDKNLDYLGCNMIFAQDAGFADPKDIIGKNDYQLVWRDQAELYRDDDRQVIESGSSKLFIEEPQTTPKGNTITILSSKIPLRSSEGEINGILGTYIDITERKRAEQALHDSEERYQSLFKDAPTALLEEDYSKVKQQIDHLQKRRGKDLGKYISQHPESAAQWTTLVKIVDVNQAALDMYKAGSKEELLAGLNTIFMDKSLPTFTKEIIALSEGKMKFEGEFLEKTLKGERLTVAVKMSVPSGFEETWSKVFVSTIDITERKRSEEALLESEEKFRNLFNNAQVGAFRTRLDGSEVLEINEKFLEILGRTRAEIIGSPSMLLWADPREREEMERRLEAEDRVVDFECRMLNKQGQIRTCLMSMHCYRAQKILEGSILDITERRQNELIQNAIYRITQTAISSEGIDALYHSIHSILGELLPAENFYIALYDSVNGLISFPYYIDQYDEPPSAPTQISGLTGYVIRTGRPLLITREIYDQLVQQGEVEPLGTASVDWLGAPLTVGGRMIGVIAVQSYTQGNHFRLEDMYLLEFVSTQIAQAIERKRLEEEIRSLSLTDELTGLYNRRGFTLLAEQEVKLAHRKNRAMLMFFGDMDGLKTINDSLGHAYGDLALKEVSAILKETFREADILARISGDEFVVLALDAAKGSAEILTDRIQAMLEARNQREDATYQLSLSLGVAPYDPEAPCTVNELIAQADSLMYGQKQARKGKK